MSYREVTMIEVKEVLRQWLARVPKKRIRLASALMRRRSVVTCARPQKAGLQPGQGVEVLTDEVLGKVQVILRVRINREHGEAWALSDKHRERIGKLLAARVRLSKVRRLLQRESVIVPYSTLHRFAVAELGFGRSGATIPVADGKPGEEVHLDTGWVGWIAANLVEGRRRFRAWIFTPHVSRHRFVYPCFAESTATAIEACEAAWEFYGGVFRVVVPDNTSAIVDEADPLGGKLVLGFLEYAQARGFVVDATRKASPKDKARVERSVRDTRDDCFAGEHLTTIEALELMLGAGTPRNMAAECTPLRGARLASTSRATRSLISSQPRPSRTTFRFGRSQWSAATTSHRLPRRSTRSRRTSSVNGSWPERIASPSASISTARS
jgi:hypothetical protein